MTTSLQQICASLPAFCNQGTSEYYALISGQTFNARANWSSNISNNTGSCGYNPSSLGAYLVALPIEFMFMSANATVCDANCNFLCGRCVRVRNRNNGASIVVQIVDTALTYDSVIILSPAAFTSLGASLNAGVINVDFTYTSC